MTYDMDYESKRELARERMAMAVKPTRCIGRGHRWVDVNEPPDRELVVCYRCGRTKAQVSR